MALQKFPQVAAQVESAVERAKQMPQVGEGPQSLGISWVELVVLAPWVKCGPLPVEQWKKNLVV